ncbi:hypothetical protein BpHYR1_030725 [Brachionus plicatilis]|uniref:Transmembrane protein n=1 Tax=Brachionus plicatilis TaxID=10195 RepID=A0A3M7RI16_BRAPC|nr:hypothetical protein BpHYR1_030725 [Brachionus plicatilis]
MTPLKKTQNKIFCHNIKVIGQKWHKYTKRIKNCEVTFQSAKSHFYNEKEDDIFFVRVIDQFLQNIYFLIKRGRRAFTQLSHLFQFINQIGLGQLFALIVGFEGLFFHLVPFTACHVLLICIKAKIIIYDHE